MAVPEQADADEVGVPILGALGGAHLPEAAPDEQDVMPAGDEVVRDVRPATRALVEALDRLDAATAVRVLVVLVALATAVVHGDPVDLTKWLDALSGW
jgi:hypothetical protein